MKYRVHLTITVETPTKDLMTARDEIMQHVTDYLFVGVDPGKYDPEEHIRVTDVQCVGWWTAGGVS